MKQIVFRNAEEMPKATVISGNSICKRKLLQSTHFHIITLKTKTIIFLLVKRKKRSVDTQC